MWRTRTSGVGRQTSLLELPSHGYKLGGLKPQKFILLVLEARYPKSRCPRAAFPTEALGEKLFHASSSSWRLPASLASGRCDLCLTLTSPSSLSVSHKDMGHWI